MFVGLLKCPKSRLESEQYPKVPWPKKVDCSALYALPIFVPARILNSRVQSKIYEREEIFGQNSLT